MSYGALYVRLLDNDGQTLQLATGKTATVTIPVPSDRTQMPSEISLWYYNASDGVWSEHGTAMQTEDDGAYSAEVVQFDLLGIGVGKNVSITCIEVDIGQENAFRIPFDRIMTVSMTVPEGGVQVKQMTLNQKTNNIYRLPSDQILTFNLLWPDGTKFSKFRLEDIDGRPIPDNKLSLNALNPGNITDRLLDTSATNCRATIKVTGNIFLPGDLSRVRSPSDHFLDAIRYDKDLAMHQAAFYYKLMDPADKRKTLYDWLDINGFMPKSKKDLDFKPEAQVVSVAYLNHNSLGSGRKMHCRKDSDRIACFVDNHSVIEEEFFNRDPAVAFLAHEARLRIRICNSSDGVLRGRGYIRSFGIWL